MPADASLIPTWIQYDKAKNEKNPVWFIDVRNTDFSPHSVLWQERVNAEIEAVLRQCNTIRWQEPVLIKCHIGEKKCQTRMLPEFCLSTVKHLKAQGIKQIACGDSTVAYTGERGYHDNHNNCSAYLGLAERHGWTEKGPLGIPFIIIDRPRTSKKGGFSFGDEEIVIQPNKYNRFKEIYIAGGFRKAGVIVNHVHLTLHDMAQVACAVKGVTMGGSSYRGKLLMHKCYSPVINDETCKRCGTCARKCPEGALIWQKAERPHSEYILGFNYRFGVLEWEKPPVPHLDKERCIGCGECIAVCHGKSISMASAEIDDWLKGSNSLPYRMADYMLGMMEGRWERLLNIVHLYNITRRCDCVDEAQKPIVEDIGFVIGRNPFAVDLMCTNLLHEEIYKNTGKGAGSNRTQLKESEILKIFFDEYHGFEPYRYIEREYGIVVQPDPIYVKMD